MSETLSLELTDRKQCIRLSQKEVFIAFYSKVRAKHSIRVLNKSKLWPRMLRPYVFKGTCSFSRCIHEEGQPFRIVLHHGMNSVMTSVPQFSGLLYSSGLIRIFARIVMITSYHFFMNRREAHTGCSKIFLSLNSRCEKQGSWAQMKGRAS